MIARAHQGRDGDVESGHPGGSADRTDTAFECGEAFLEHRHGGI